MNSKYEKYFDEDINSRNHLNIKTNFLSSTEYNIKNYINENNNESESDTFDKPKRRSINDKKGRTFICKICNKSYLSYSALYTHCKGKHNSTDVSDRARGRPRKNTENYLKERTKYNPLDKSYFLKKERTGITEIYDFEDCIINAFNIIYDKSNYQIRERNNKKKMIEYQKVYEHPFLGKFLVNKHDRNKKIYNEYEISDKVFMHYLNKMSLYVNPNYFVKLITFITLFREFINISNRKNLMNDIDEDLFVQYKKYKMESEYTSCNCAEEIPDYCNDFINNFLESDINLFNFNKIESIDLTQNFCSWIYDNNFTTLRLSLILRNNL